MSVVVPMFPTLLGAEATWDATRPSDAYCRIQDAQGHAAESDADTLGVDSLSRLIDLLEESGEDDYGVTSPTQYAFKSAYKLIALAEKRMALRVAGSPCVDSVGGIRVTWKLGEREVRLVCPSTPTEHVYIYQQSGAQHETVDGVTPVLLAHKLSWLISGGDTL